jgi:hypothetical protein
MKACLDRMWPGMPAPPRRKSLDADGLQTGSSFSQHAGLTVSSLTNPPMLSRHRLSLLVHFLPPEDNSHPPTPSSPPDFMALAHPESGEKSRLCRAPLKQAQAKPVIGLRQTIYVKSMFEIDLYI